MKIVWIVLAALVGAVLVKWISERMLRGESPYGPVSEQKKQELIRKTQELAALSRQKDFAHCLKDIEILELGAFEADIIGASLREGQPEKQKSDEEEKVTVQPGEDVALTLRWRNTGEKPIRRAVFAVAFLSPSGEILFPDALEKDPWMRSFGAAAAASFTGHFPKGQGRQQRDMKNAFLLYHGPVSDAVILGMQLTYEDGSVFEQRVDAPSGQQA